MWALLTISTTSVRSFISTNTSIQLFYPIISLYSITQVNRIKRMLRCILAGKNYLQISRKTLKTFKNGKITKLNGKFNKTTIDICNRSSKILIIINFSVLKKS